MKRLLLLIAAVWAAGIGLVNAQSATCADVNSGTSGTSLTLGEVTCVFVSSDGKNCYVQDATGTTLLYKTNFGLLPGDVVSGLEGKVSIYRNLPEFVPTASTIAATGLTVTHGAAPVIADATAAPVEADINKVLMFRNVNLGTVSGSSKTTYTATFMGSNVAFYNQFGVALSCESSKTYDILGCVAKYNSTLQVYIGSIVEHSDETQPITVRLFKTAQICSGCKWPSVYLYAWDANQNPLLGTWPGTQVSLDNDGWYSYTFPVANQNVNIIWNSGIDGYQTIDITNVMGSTSYALGNYSNNKYAASAILANTPTTPQNCAYVSANTGSNLELNEVTLVYKKAPYYYIQDASGSMLLYSLNSAYNQLTFGDKIQGMFGSSKLYNGYAEFEPMSYFGDLTITSGAAPEIPVATAAPTMDDLHKVYRFENMSIPDSFPSATKKNIVGYMPNGASVILRNEWGGGYVFDANKTYDLVGCVSAYGNTVQVAVAEIAVHGGETVSLDTITLGFQPPMCWPSVYVYAWDDEENALLGTWPGEQVTASDGWYYKTILSEGAVNYIWNSGNTNLQTADLRAPASKCERLSGMTQGTYSYVYTTSPAECGSAMPELTITDKSFAQALAIGQQMPGNIASLEYYRVTGVVSSVSTSAEALVRYKNCDFMISDPTGASNVEMKAFRAKWLANADFTSADQIPVQGDTVTLVAPLYNFAEGVIEMYYGYVESITRKVVPVDTIESNVCAAYEACAALNAGTLSDNYYRVTGVVNSVLQKFSDDMTETFLMDCDEDTRLEGLGVHVEGDSFAEIGDTVVVLGKLHHYSNMLIEGNLWILGKYIAPIATDTITLGFMKPAEWDSVCYYSWTPGASTNVWPGIRVIPDANGWCYVTFTAIENGIDYIWNNGSNVAQTVNLHANTSTCERLGERDASNGNNYTTIAVECGSVIEPDTTLDEDGLVMRLYPSPAVEKWEHVYAYVWMPSGEPIFGNFPGKLATVDSLGWPTVTLPSGVTDVKLLWSDGTNANQSEDVEGIVASTCFALGARNSYGRFTFVQSEIGSYDMDCTLPIEKVSVAEALALPRNTLVKMKDLSMVWTKTYDNTSYYYAKDSTGSICVKVYYGSDGPQPGMVVGDLYGYIDNDGLTPYFIPCTSPRDMVISQGAMPELPLMVNEPTAADVNKVFRLQNVNMDGVRWTTTRSRSSFGLYLPSGAFVNLRNFFGDALTSPDDGTTYNMTGAVALTNDEIQVYVGDFEVNTPGTQDTTGHDTIPEVEPIVLRVSKASVDAAGWNQVHLFVWNDELQNYAIHGEWPGDTVALDSTGWYTAEINAAYAPFNIIWGNGGNGAGNQTYDILDVAASGCYSVRFDPEYMSEAKLYGITVDCDVVDSVPEYVEDTTAHMVYITYNLTGLGNYVDSIQVAHGGSVTLPEPPQFEGYHFVFWEGLYDGSNVLNNVKRDMYMRATYHINLPEDEPSNPITVRLEASSVPEEWDNVYIFSWNTGDEKSTLWPGTPMRLVDDWYTYTFTAGAENVDFLFNANNAEELGFANQTVDVDDVNSNYCFRMAPQKNEKAYYMVYLAECGAIDTTGHDTIPEAEPITLRLSKASVDAIGWDTVHLYVWNDELENYAINGAWPGNEVALDSTGNWYTGKVSSAYAPFNIIWGNGHDGGHNQTINIEYVLESTCYSVRINPELPGGKLRAEELVDCAVEDSVPVFVPDTSIHTVYYFSGLTGLTFDSVQVVHGSPVPLSTANVPAVAGYHFYSWRVSPGDFYDYVWHDMFVEAAYQLDMPADTVAPIVIRLKASSVPADWETVNIMSWTAYGDPSEIGYGVPMTLDTLGWYTYIFNSEYESVDFLFNNGEWNGDNQSIDVFGVTSSQCLQLAAPLDTIEGKAYPMVYLADCEGADTIQIEGMTIRFMDEQYQGGWQKGYLDLYAWHNVDGVDVPVLGEWPGASMSFDSVTGWWSYTLPAGYCDLNFVISSGTVQTSDILHVSESSCYQLSNYVGISNYGQYVNNVKQIDCATNPSDYHIVYFMAMNNEYVLWSGYVLDGDSAIAPEAPLVEGYRFVGWSRDFSSVTENMSITAIYEAYDVYVYVVDWDGRFLCYGSFPYGSSRDISILDDFIPSREGYEFIGWSNDLQNLTKVRFIVALYRPITTGNTSVIYLDRVGGQITQQEVDLYLPTPPVYEGYTFVRWDVLGGELSEGIRIQAVYQYDGTGTDAPSVDGEELQPRKEFRQGIIYVLKPDGAVYSVAGQRIK